MLDFAILIALYHLEFFFTQMMIGSIKNKLTKNEENAI